MTLRIEAFPGGPFETNTYLVADLESGEALVVDAAQGTVEAVRAAAAGRGWRVGRIVITHSHWDHIVDAVAMKEALGVPILTPVGAEEALANPGSFFGGLDVEIPPVTPDQAIGEGDEVALGGHRFAVLHLPGHEPYHIALHDAAAEVLLSGDVLFPNGHGRTDLPGSDQATMNASLHRLRDLPEGTTVYPGHGAPTTIGAERGWLADVP
jgi:glyoxylase-like metal-dependent hydrolase (beta-lactamase superfamily II)